MKKQLIKMGQKCRRGEWRRVTARNIFLPRFFEYSVPPTIPYINEIFKNKKKDKKKKERSRTRAPLSLRGIFLARDRTSVVERSDRVTISLCSGMVPCLRTKISETNEEK